MSDTNGQGVLLRGLDGSNPLAFLAALGTLRTLTLALPDETVKMSWEQSDGAWRLRVWCSLSHDTAAIVAKLGEELATAINRPSFAVGDNLNLPAKEFRSHLCKAVEHAESLTTPRARVDADFLAAFGSEVITDDSGTMTDTALRTMSGAGHQHFLKFFREVVQRTDAGHLRRALFSPWDYADEGRGLNLRWDPLDDRRYALRWEDPSGDPVKTMRGANRLAIEALPLLPTMAVGNDLATTTFTGKGARDTYFTWPIWSAQLTEPIVRSLLGQVGTLCYKDKATEERRRGIMQDRLALGVVAVYTSARITIGKFRNFTPGVPA